MRSQIFLFLLLAFCLPFLTQGQEKKEVLLTDVLKEVIKTGESTTVSNAIISMRDISAGVWPNLADSVWVNGIPVATNQNYLELDKYLKVSMPGEVELKNGRVVIPGEILFLECDFPDGMILNGLHFEQLLVFSRCTASDAFYFENVFINKINSHWDVFSDFRFENTKIENELHFHWGEFRADFSVTNSVIGHKIEIEDVKLLGKTVFKGNHFELVKDFELTSLSNDSIYFGRNWSVYDRLVMNIPESSGLFSFSENTSGSDNPADIYWFNGHFDEVLIKENNLSGIVNLSMRADRFVFLKNKFDKISLDDFSFSETSNDIEWKDFAGQKLSILNEIDQVNDASDGFNNFGFEELGIVDSSSFETYFDYQSEILAQIYFGENQAELADQENFRKLFRSYYKLYSALRANGDIESANACYVEMKKLESRRLKFQFNQTGEYDLLFKYGLNSLLGFYTDQGTNPSKAVRVSFYLILLFAVFYFFFPSEWDKESKKEMIGHYRLFIVKNDHGYFRPFMKLLGGILLSLINAIALSMNAFVTLGFGRIPAKGLAKYICILEGTVGWFLLSIFTVSLINQLLI